VGTVELAEGVPARLRPARRRFDRRHHFLGLGLGDGHGQQRCEQSLVDLSDERLTELLRESQPSETSPEAGYLGSPLPGGGVAPRS